jgi:Flp pilus assembly pilin Flp
LSARGWRSESGQTTTEWVMIAGLLSAVGIAIFDIRRDWTIGGTLIFVTKSMFTFLRTMAP